MQRVEDDLTGYDVWKTRLPEESKPVAVCDFCLRELYEGDVAYQIDGDTMCEDCLKKEYRRIL